MLRLRKILLFDLLYFIILLLVLVISLIRIFLPSKTNYKSGIITETFIITKITIDGNKLTLHIKNKETEVGQLIKKTEEFEKTTSRKIKRAKYNG